MTPTEKLKMFRDCAQDIVTLPVRYLKYIHDAQEVSNKLSHKHFENEGSQGTPKANSFLSNPKTSVIVQGGFMAGFSLSCGALAVLLGAGPALSVAFGLAAGGVGMPVTGLKIAKSVLGDLPPTSRIPAPIKILPSLHNK